MSVTAKGRTWEVLHSLWIGWTFTLGFFNWVAFLYIGFRVKQRKWLLWALLYSVPFILAIGFGIGTAGQGVGPRWLGDLNVALTIVLGVISIFHAFRVRKEYLLRLEAAQYRSRRSDSVLKDRVAAEYGVENRGEESAQNGSGPAVLDAPGSKTEQDTSDKRVKHADPALPGAARSEPNVINAAQPSTSVLRNIDQPLPRIASGDNLEYQISGSYPFPIAFGFRSLMSLVDHRDLYREQLRIAENILAFLASISLVLLKEQDRSEVGVDPKDYWRSGISPGDWRDIVGRCSKVLLTYEDNPLALDIAKLSVRSEKKGFGQDVSKLIQAKNDYKHDRGPTVLEDFVELSQEVQERLKRCMERLFFFANYPIRQVEDFDVSRSGDQYLLKCLRYMGDHPSFPQEEVVFHRGLRRGDLFLELNQRHWVPLYPFIATKTCSHCKAKETYFVDLWDPKRGTARLKSFERGHTTSSTDVSDALARWNDQS